MSKELKYQNYEFKLEYVVKEATLTSFNIVGLQENYTVYPDMNTALLSFCAQLQRVAKSSTFSFPTPQTRLVILLSHTI